MREANAGKLSRGTLQWALTELNLSKTRFVELWKRQYLPYRQTFPEADPAEAFSPHSEAGGRPRGRDIPPDITRAIQQLYKERGFTSLNYDGTENLSRLPVLAKGILSGIKTLFPEYADTVKLYDVYAAIHDLWKREAANVHLARGNEAMVDANLPTRNSDVEGSDEQWQIDIRPLPGYVRYGGLICTIVVVVIADRASGRIWAGRLIPGVKVKDGKATDEDVWSGDYKAQEIRDLIATAILRAKRCFRMLYPDNGPHFKYIVLGPYMPYLASESQDGTQVYRPQLVNRTPEAARGGGFIENLLGNLDSWMRKFYGHYDEDVENFRQFYRIVNRNSAHLPEFEAVAKDFQGHIRYLNTQHRDEADHLTREERWKQGPDKSCPMPPLLHLAIFAKQVTKTTRKVQRYGFSYDNKQWEFERDDAEFRSIWTNAALNPEKREIIVMKIERETIIFMNVSGDGRTYERAIPKGKPRNTVKQDNALNQEARRIIEEENRADSAALDETIRMQLAGGQLFIHPAGKRLIDRSAVPPIDGTKNIASVEDQLPQNEWEASPESGMLPPGNEPSTQPDIANQPSADGEMQSKASGDIDHAERDAHTSAPITPSISRTTGTSRAKQQRARKRTCNTSQPDPPRDCSNDPDDEDDDWADFEGLAW
jgi:hypothetical protein